MPDNCCVCKKFYGCPGISLHRLPLDFETREKWKKAIGKDVGNSVKVCSDHFAPEDFLKEFERGASIIRKIKRGVTPSLLLNNAAISNKEMIEDYQNLPIAEIKTEDETLIEIKYCEIAEIKTEDETNPEIKYCENYKNKSLRTSIIIKADHGATPSHLLSNVAISNKEMLEDYQNVLIAEIETEEDETPAEINQCENEGNKSLRNIFCANRKTKLSFKSSANKQHRVRYIGDLKPEDFTSPESYEVVQKYYNVSKSKIDCQRKIISRLKAKMKSATDLLSMLKSKGLITSNGSPLMELDDWELQTSC